MLLPILLCVLLGLYLKETQFGIMLCQSKMETPVNVL